MVWEIETFRAWLAISSDRDKHLLNQMKSVVGSLDWFASLRSLILFE